MASPTTIPTVTPEMEPTKKYEGLTPEEVVGKEMAEGEGMSGEEVAKFEIAEAEREIKAEPTEQYESLEGPMSYSDWIGKQVRNEKKAVIYDLVGVERADKLFKEQPYLSLDNQTKIAKTMISETQLDLMQVYDAAKKMEDGGLNYFEEAFSGDFSDLKAHEWSLYYKLYQDIESDEIRRENRKIREDKSINKQEKAILKKSAKELQFLSLGKNGIDNAMMQMTPNLGLREVEEIVEGKKVQSRTVTEAHRGAVETYYKDNGLGVPDYLKDGKTLAKEIQESYDQLEGELKKGIRTFAFIGKPGEERVQGKNYFELIKGEPSDEMKESDGFESWGGNPEYVGSPGSVDDGVVQSALLKLKNIIDITQSAGETGLFFHMGEKEGGMNILGISAKKARNSWFKAMMNEYEKYKDSLIKASTVPLEEEEEPEEKVDKYGQYEMQPGS